jgi:hypothetical protein
MGIALTLLFCLFCVPLTAHAASSTQQVKESEQEYTIAYLDEQGKVAKTWKGTKEEADKIKKEESEKRKKQLE